MRPSGRILAGAGRSIARVPRAIGGAARAFWFGLSLQARRRAALALGAAVLLVLFFSLAVPNLPCQLPGGDRCPPDDEADDLVPADALAYVHLNLDPDSDQYDRAAELFESLPLFSEQITARALARLTGPGGEPPEFERDLEPWIGDEAALALVPGAPAARSQVELFEIDDAKGADAFAGEVAAERPRSDEYRGVELTIDSSDIATAQVGGFLAIGAPEALRALIDVERGGEAADPLAEDPRAVAARDELPDHRVLDAYLSEEGVGELIADGSGAPASLAPFLAPGSTRGAAIALAAGENELELTASSLLDPERSQAQPGFFAAFPAFEPELPERLSADSLGYLGIGDPGRTVRALLAQASAQAPGIAAGFEELVESLRRSGEVDIERDLLPALGGEAAFALASNSPGGPAEAARPYVEFVADDVDEERARRALASLQAPVADSFDQAAGLQAPVFSEREIAGVEARSLSVSPAVDLTYAVFDGLAVVATDPAGVSELAGGDGGLDGAERFERATEDFDDEVSLLGFFDLDRLVALGERLGLAEDPVYATFAPEFRRLGAVALAVRSEPELLSTEIRLLIGRPEGPTDPAPALEPGD